MQFKKLTADHKNELRWKAKRNRSVSKLLAENPKMLSTEALAEANRQMREAERKSRK